MCMHRFSAVVCLCTEKLLHWNGTSFSPASGWVIYTRESDPSTNATRAPSTPASWNPTWIRPLEGPLHARLQNCPWEGLDDLPGRCGGKVARSCPASITTLRSCNMRSSFALRHTTLPVAVCMYRFSAATCIYDLVPPTIQTVTAPPSTTARSGTSRKRGSAALAVRPWNHIKTCKSI